VRFIGLGELLGGAGLILPAARRIAPAVTPPAASALTLVMLLASMLHISRGEFTVLPVPVVIGALCAFVAWGRSGKARIPAR
jgi:putative oxidoreductase